MRHVAALALPIFLAACSDAAASPSEDAGSTGDAASTVDQVRSTATRSTTRRSTRRARPAKEYYVQQLAQASGFAPL